MLTNGAPNRFRILPSYKNEGPKYAEYAKYRKAKRIFMLTLNVSPTEDEFTRYVEPELTKMGVEHVRERFEMSTADYRSLVLKAVAYKPDLIIINGLSFHILPRVQNLNALGFIKDGNVVCVMDTIDLLYGEKVPAGLEGIAFISPFFEIPGAVPHADEWRARFHKAGGKVANYVQAYAYDTGRLLVEAYVKQKSVRPASLKAVFPYEGVCGKMSLDADRDLVTDLGFVKIAAGGKLVPIDATVK